MITFLKNIFSPSVTSLTASITRNADKLQSLADSLNAKAQAKREQAAFATIEAIGHEDEAAQATSVGSRLRALVS